MRRVVVRDILTLATLVAGLGGMLAFTLAAADGSPNLVPVARIDPAGPAYLQLAALHTLPEEPDLRYEPSKRDHEGDDDDEDEPRR
ncbi:hypothetical protein JQ619_30265 [Bradyrhizobium denitrificans]|uniref:Uncharacterized protein n=1 Tax=Bradyrhizobium denitrificans TaxID=2734912 RepID=A0ABS5GFW4_9BRAD|nr:hypothetical protein [Bradyrhizobium denitrificans]NPU26019.1 hypothetical protein [Bradyrhizobium sp. LMG 8443]